MTEKRDRLAEALTAPLTDNQVSAFTGRSLNDFIYFESDFDGDLHAVGIATPEQVAEWTVTYIRPNGSRDPARHYCAVMFHNEWTCGRPVWYADCQPGTQLEIRLPDGPEFVVDASRNLRPR